MRSTPSWRRTVKESTTMWNDHTGPIMVTCQECKGRRRMSYIDSTPSVCTFPVRPDEESTLTILHDQPCRTCKGVGRIKPTKRIPVIQFGRQVGTVPPDFDPARLRNRSLYRPRPGDFIVDGDTWVACTSLGGGDLESVPGFEWTDP